MEVFRLLGSIFVDNDQANKSIDQTDNKAKKTGLTLGGLVGTAAKMGAGILAGASVAGAGLLSLVNRTANVADEIDKLSERTGINRESLQRWKYAAEQSGGDIRKLEVGMKKLSDVMNDASTGNDKAAEGFAKLGISVDDLKNKSQEDIFETVMASLGDMEQGAERNALGNDLLGKSYTELLPLLNAGSEGMDALKNRADELGLVMSEDAVKAGVVLGDTMADVKGSFGAIFTHLGTEFMPMFQVFLEWVLAHMPEIQEFVSTALGKVAEGLFWLTDNAIPPLVDAFQWLGDNVLPLVVDAFQLLGDGVQFVMDNMDIFLPIIIGLTAAILAQAVIGTITNLMKAWSTATKSQTAFQWLLNAALNANPLGLVALAIGAVIAAGILLWKNWDTVKEKASQFWNYLKEVMKGPANFILGAINTIIGAYEKMINGLGSAINKIPSIKIPDWVPVYGGNEFGIPDIPSISLPRIPLLAEGGDIIEAGRVIVGEEGPEFLDLPKGAKVTPLDNEPDAPPPTPSVIIVKTYIDGREVAEATSRPNNDRVSDRKWGSGRVVPV